ncbi:hypothetical protein [Pseudobacter ginsenosidimutans]|uniref:Lipocalin-like protein n=1 Tax=Pseudobacter ginsenosidimutans TaxID=661488 RepID=A0A4Q7MUZ1_9BACT|nr:hypothetical protein [Pseudobacter ginsenosidimutans]QEC42244.1 hypothetical protein FSB84_11270 [Pseudobacter ginsenosidimutans]RZS70913.1 hypothetical protein EV199_2812 [Pseudobacter ginsenosidimutans]
MKKLLLLILLPLLAATTGCKKMIEKKIEAELMNAITSGAWYVEHYRENATDITASFNDYEFRFQRDGTVQGLRNGHEPDKGTWQGNLENASISALFPTATDPLKKVNGHWKITDSYMDYVEAEMSIQGGKNILHLRKK